MRDRCAPSLEPPAFWVADIGSGILGRRCGEDTASLSGEPYYNQWDELSWRPLRRGEAMTGTERRKPSDGKIRDRQDRRKAIQGCGR